jgi:hypothetical protein
MKKIIKIIFFCILSLSCNSDDSENTDYILITDAEFERHLIMNGHDSEGVFDNKMLLSDAEKIESLGIGGRAHIDERISDLTGIEYFKNLNSFISGNHTIRHFNFINNDNLASIRIDASNIEGVILPKKSSLEYLEVNLHYQEQALEIDLTDSKELAELILGGFDEVDLKNNINLKRISIGDIWNGGYNETLVISHLDSLESLFISGSLYSKLDVSLNNNLNFLRVDYDNPNLKCVKIKEGQSIRHLELNETQFLSTNCN